MQKFLQLGNTYNWNLLSTYIIEISQETIRKQYETQTFSLLPPLRVASTNVRMACTQASKLAGVTWAASLTRKANDSQHFLRALVSWNVILLLRTISNWFSGTADLPSLLTC